MVRAEEETYEEDRKAKTITIEWLDDIEIVEGFPEAITQGAIVRLGDETILELEPSNSKNPDDYADYSPEEVYLRILTHLGYEVDFEFDDNTVYKDTPDDFTQF